MFYSVLNHLKTEYNFSIQIDESYTIAKGSAYEKLAVNAPKILKKIRYKYFSDTLVKMYKKYKAKGFTIFSIALDKEKDAWINAIEQDKLTWPYHGSNLLHWNCPIAVQYNIESTPTTFLIDENGTFT